jgi:citrate lyase subunit beta/citryl-CoA lyase
MSDRPRRSALYMPASNAKAVEKARTLPCDVVILDLEDAVAPDAKPAAREAAAAAVRAGGWGGREVVIRVNGLDTEWGEQDLVVAAGAAPDAILVPKVNGPDDVERYHKAIVGAPETTRLWAMIETARSLFALDAIADAAPTTRLEAFVMGTNDLAKEMRWRQTPGREPFRAALSLSVAAARANGLTVLDGVYNGIEDDAGLQAVCEQGVDFGMDGKTLIHPRQIEICNRVFSPSGEEVAFARAVIAASRFPRTAARGSSAWRAAWPSSSTSPRPSAPSPSPTRSRLELKTGYRGSWSIHIRRRPARCAGTFRARSQLSTNLTPNSPPCRHTVRVRMANPSVLTINHAPSGNGSDPGADSFAPSTDRLRIVQSLDRRVSAVVSLADRRLRRRGLLRRSLAGWIWMAAAWAMSFPLRCVPTRDASPVRRKHGASAA